MINTRVDDELEKIIEVLIKEYGVTRKQAMNIIYDRLEGLKD